MIEEPERVLAKLFHDTNGVFTREMFLDLTDWDINNWLCRPDANADIKDRPWYWPVDRASAEHAVERMLSGPAEMFMLTRGKAMKTLGASDAEIAEACERFLHPAGAGSGFLGDD